MKKSEELANPQSCLNRAADDELIFVLLAHDRASAATVRAWVGERLRMGKNVLGDPQIQSALRWAAMVEATTPNPCEGCGG
jgi:hypothetical protein